MRCGREEAVPKLKVCGITDAAFAVEAARRGVDYLGLIFAEGSPRRVTVEKADEIISAVRSATMEDVPAIGHDVSIAPRFVGVFVDHSVDEIISIASRLKLDVIQLHGNYDAEKIAAIKSEGYEVWRLYAPTGESQLVEAAIVGADDVLSFANAVLLDGRKGTQCGGTGMRADWSLVEPFKRAGRRVVLAGGISADNIADAIATGADIIDANSTLETAPGVKTVGRLDTLLASFLHGAR